MKFLIFIFFIFSAQFCTSQIRFYAQGFENLTPSCPENWTYSGGNRTTQHAQTGSFSARVGRSGESNTLILDPIDVSLLSNATLRLNHSILGGSGPGIDVREGVIFMVSVDGGAFTTVSRIGGSNDHSYSWTQTGGVGVVACVAPNDVTYQTPNTFTFPIPVGTTTVSVKIISVNVQTGANAAIKCTNFVAMMTNPTPTASNFDRNDEGIYIDDVEIWADGPSIQAPISICENDAFAVGVNNTNAGMTFAWSGPNGFSSISQNPQVSSAATTAMAGNYSNVVTFGSCPIMTLNQVVTVNSAPNLVVSGPLVFCAGTNTTLTASGGIAYQWSDGLGSNSSATITTAGNYTVTASGSGTCTSQETVTVSEITSQTNYTTVSECDTYTWLINNQTYSQSGNYTFVNGCTTENLVLTITTSTQNTTTVSACDSYLWLQNGTTYTTSGIYTHLVGCNTEILNLTIAPSSTNTTIVNSCNSYTWALNGQTYTASGIYTFLNGCLTEELDLTIQTAPILTFNSPSVCQGQVATLTVSSNQPNTTFLWSDGQTTSNINVSPSISSAYNVVGSNVYGCSSNGIGMVNITPSPVLTYQDTSVCLGQSVTISVSPMTAGGTYLWNTGETTTSIQVTPTQNTAYTLIYTLNTCQSSVAVINVIIAPPFVLNASNVTICQGNTATIIASSTLPGGVFTWGNGSTVSSALFSPQADTTVTFSYVLNGCTTSASATITVLELPDLSFNASQTEGCAPLTISFSTPFLESSLCSWKIDGQEVSTNCGDLNYSFNNPNCYDISLTILGTNGCSNTVSYTDLVCVYENPIANFYFNELANYQTSANVGFTNSSENALQNWWNFGDGGTAINNNNPTHTYIYENATSFIVELIVESEFGCRDSIQKEVSFKEELNVYIPNTFTPDGIGLNEIWLPIFSTLVNEGNYECSVLNRYGEQIFYTNDYRKGWDGTYEGKKSQDGTYSYYIQYSGLGNAKSTILTGHINLLR
jgi:gliding motility-associated-like protein